ncbi:hypothetical protein CBS101457_005535 [Exobasidium rhododendri]|nr:hypothetical protein CBS101457_005535 [Exobasidium rhododendri]
MSDRKEAYDAGVRFTTSQPLDPAWKVGQGLNSHETSAKAERVPYKIIEVGKTQVEARAMYKIMLGAISPRPVALVGTYNTEGLANLAPVSWYQMVSHDPPLVMLSFGGSRERIKDSERNIHDNKCFTISSASEPYAEALNFASINAPPGVSEFALSGLTPVPGRTVRAPRVAEAPFSMELEVDFTREWNNDAGRHTTTLVIGRVKMLYIREDILDSEHNINPAASLPISRFAGKLYSRSTHGFELDVPTWDKYKDTEETRKAVQAGTKQPSPDSNIDAVLQSFP